MKQVLFKSMTGTAAVLLAASFVFLIIIGHVSTPVSSGPLGILAVFTLIYIFCTSLIMIALGGWAAAKGKLGLKRTLSRRRRYYVSSVLGFLPVLYVTLLSMGGASVWGIGLIGLFTGLMLFYVLRRSA